MHSDLCPELGSKDHGEACKTCNGSGMVVLDVAGIGDNYVPYGFSVVHGATGNPVGRPSRKPKVRTEADGAFLYGYKPSSKDDWARERREREEAAARAKKR